MIIKIQLQHIWNKDIFTVANMQILNMEQGILKKKIQTLPNIWAKFHVYSLKKSFLSIFQCNLASKDSLRAW